VKMGGKECDALCKQNQFGYQQTPLKKILSNKNFCTIQNIFLFLKYWGKYWLQTLK